MRSHFLWTLYLMRLSLTMLSLIVLNACVSPHYGQRSDEDVREIVQQNNMQSKQFQTRNHKILGAVKAGDPHTLHVYIEGDGLAWLDETHIAHDPTPTDPLALRLLVADQSTASKVYLARPGQYFQDPRLGLEDWTFARFSQETIASYDQILDQLKGQYPKARIILLGYSGGAMIALLTAAQRFENGKKDIKGIVTFAGVLDHEVWCRQLQVSPLHLSLNSKAYINILKHIPQKHYSGEKDQVVPSVLTQAFVHSLNRPLITMESVPDVNHWNGWEGFWQKESRSLP